MPQPLRCALYLLLAGLLLLGCTSPARPITPAPAPTAATVPPSPSAAPSATAMPAPTRTPRPLPGVTFELAGQFGGAPCELALQGDHACLGLGPRLAIADVSDTTALTITGQSEVLPSLVQAVAAGDRYAYAGAGSLLYVFETAGQATPRLVGQPLALPGAVRALVLAGGRAYVCTLDSPAPPTSSLTVLDLAEPAAPRRLGSLSLPGEALDLAIHGSYALVAASFGGLRIVDLAEPARPREVASLAADWQALNVAASGHYAYVATTGAGLRVADLRDPTHPRDLGPYLDPDNPWPPVFSRVRVEGARAYAITSVGEFGAGWSSLAVLDLADPSGPRPLGEIRNLPGYASGLAVADGRAYCILGDLEHAAGLCVIDAHAATHPRQAGLLVPPGAAQGVGVTGGHAYVWAGNSLRAVDVRDPANPRQAGPALEGSSLGRLAIDDGQACFGGGPEGGYPLPAATLGLLDLHDRGGPRLSGSLQIAASFGDLALAGRYAYLASGPSLRVVDVQDPAHPVDDGFVNIGYYLSSVAVAGSHAYLVGSLNQEGREQGALWVVDVADPANRRRVGQVLLPAAGAGLAVAGRYAYVTTRGCQDPGEPSRQGGLAVADLSDPTQPHVVGSLPLRSAPWDLEVSGDRVYLPATDVLQVIDVSDPAEPQEVGAYRAPTGLYGVRVVGDYAYLAAGSAGLLILRLGLGAPYAAEPWADIWAPQPAVTRTVACAGPAGPGLPLAEAGAPLATLRSTTALSAPLGAGWPVSAMGQAILFSVPATAPDPADVPALGPGPELWAYHSSGDRWEKVLDHAWRPVWCDWGRIIFFLDQGRLESLDLTSGQISVTVHLMGPSPAAPFISRPLADGSLLAVSGEGRLAVRNSLYYNLAWLEGIPIRSAGDRAYLGQNGDPLAIVRGGGSEDPEGQPATIEIYEAGRGHTVLIHGCAVEGGTGWAPGGARLAYCTAGAYPELRVYDVRTGESRVLVRGSRPGERFAGPAWSSRGDCLAFTRHTNDGEAPSIWLVSTDGSRVQRLPGAAEQPVFIPDATSARLPKDSLLYRAATGTRWDWYLSRLEYASAASR